MRTVAVVVVSAALLVAHSLAHPAPDAAHPEPNTHLHKRAAAHDTPPEALANFRDILRIVNMYRTLEEEAALKKVLEGGEETGDVGEEAKEVRKRMFAPLSGLPGEVSTIKRQIRYHQCYFNPISCFRRK